MPPLLYIPWFRAEPWEFSLPVVGEIAIQPFGVLVAIGILLGAKLAEKHAERSGIDAAVIADLATFVVPVGLICAFVLNGVFYAPERVWLLLSEPTWENFKRYGYLGLSSYGGFIGTVLGGFIWRQRRRMSLIVAGSAGAFGFPFGWLFGRTGCFIVHDHPGRVTDFPLAVANYYGQGQPRHDLGLYEVFWSLAVCTLFLCLWRKRRRHGLYLGLLPVLYGPIRFFLDFLRAPPEAGGDVRYLGLTPGQYGSVLLTIAGIVILWRVYRGEEPQLVLDDEDNGARARKVAK